MQRLLFARATGADATEAVELHPLMRELGLQWRTPAIAVFAFSFVINLLMLAVPIYLLQIYDRVLPHRNVDSLWFLSLLVVAALLLHGVLEGVRGTVMNKLGVRLERALGAHVLSSALQDAIDRRTASVNIVRDLDAVRSFLSSNALFPILDAPWTPLFLLVLWLLHPVLGLIALVGVVVLALLAVLSEVLTDRRLRRADEASNLWMDQASSYVRSADAIRAMGMERRIVNRWQQSGETMLSDSFQVSRFGSRLKALSQWLRMVLQVGIIAAAAWLILDQQLSSGATIASILLFRGAITPVEQLVSGWKSVLRIRHALTRINAALSDADTLKADRELPNPEGNLYAEGIGYRRDSHSHPVFTDVNIVVEPGQLVVIHGLMASGKSSLVRVLAGVTPPTLGRISFAGFELDHFPREQLGRHIGYLPQEVALLAGSIRDNISRFSDARIEQVVAAAKQARAHEMIQQLPDGYDTLLLDSGLNLSGGQRQKVALARALFGEPSLLILDEPDANLDARARFDLAQALGERRAAGTAIVVVTHDERYAQLADKLYQLDKGRLYKTRDRLSANAPVQLVGKDLGPAVNDSGESTNPSGAQARLHGDSV